jgi:hypothetical protein
MRTSTKCRTPGPGQLVLILPGLPAGQPHQPRVRRPQPAPERPPVTASRPVPRPHGPVKARQIPGELHGAAPTARQVRTMTLNVEQLDGGKWRLTLPRIPAWAAVAATPSQVAVGIRSAFTELQIAAYADWRNTVLDIDVVTYRRRRPKRSAAKKVRKDVHPPEAWRLTGESDARGVPLWQSPGAKQLCYAEDCQVVQRVIAKREKAGLAPRPDLPPAPVETPDNVVQIRRRKSA